MTSGGLIFRSKGNIQVFYFYVEQMKVNVSDLMEMVRIIQHL